MMTRQERKVLGIAHKAALLDQLDRRMEIARQHSNQVLLQQLEDELNYINGHPSPLRLLLSPVKAKKSGAQRNSWKSEFWSIFGIGKPKSS